MTNKPEDIERFERFLEGAEERASRDTFERRIEKLEAICRSTPGVSPNRPHDVSPEKHSEAWYAEEILFAIRAARQNIKSGQASYAAYEALTIAVLAAEAGAAFKLQKIQQLLRSIENDHKETWLIGQVESITSLAGQNVEMYGGKRYGLDGEIEFKDDNKRPTGQRVYLQLKSGDSYLRPRKHDSTEIFRIRNKCHADYWMKQAYPVFIVIANSQAEIRWMEISDYLKRESANGKQLSQLVFTGEPFDVGSVHRWRNRLLHSHLIPRTD